KGAASAWCWGHMVPSTPAAAARQKYFCAVATSGAPIMPGMGTAAPTAGREPFRRFFRAVVGHAPYPYQERLAFEPWPETLIIPTGLGKTAAVLAAWLWRVSQSDPSTPRRLVYCLPMRTLVEQTEAVARCWTAAAASELRLGPVQVAALMGGSGSPRTRVPVWMLEPALPTLLVGTQDLLVSAALMRAYGASRYRWPVDFALLHAGAYSAPRVNRGRCGCRPRSTRLGCARRISSQPTARGRTTSAARTWRARPR